MISPDTLMGLLVFAGHHSRCRDAQNTKAPVIAGAARASSIPLDGERDGGVESAGAVNEMRALGLLFLCRDHAARSWGDCFAPVEIACYLLQPTAT